MQRNTLFLALGLLCKGVWAHGGHSQKPAVADDADWMTKHMAEEHHLDTFDAASFFSLHDYDADGQWESEEIQRTYGLMDVSNKDLPDSKRSEVASEVLKLIDRNGNGAIDLNEWEAFYSSGGRLPDLGTGPGHHGDDEYEYEIHHWEKYHDENTRLEDLTHPEDIEHFKKHEEMEAEAERLEMLTQQSIVLENVPGKFRRI